MSFESWDMRKEDKKEPFETWSRVFFSEGGDTNLSGAMRFVSSGGGAVSSLPPNKDLCLCFVTMATGNIQFPSPRVCLAESK